MVGGSNSTDRSDVLCLLACLQQVEVFPIKRTPSPWCKRLRPKHNEEVGGFKVSTVLSLLFVELHHFIHAELLRKLGAVAGPCGGMEWWKVREEAHVSGGAQA